MAERTSHPAGAFSWAELATSDLSAAKAFYAVVFGWDYNDIPLGDGQVYSMAQIGGKNAAALYQGDPPPHWNNYVTVDDVDAISARVEELGGQLVAPPFDVMDVGRMAVLQDPTGAVFQVWEAKKHIGAKILNEPGALCWTELTTSDTKAAEQFYTQLFGWTPKHSAAGAPMEYPEFSVSGTPSIGMMAKPKDMPAHIPSYWMPYFQVTSVDGSASKAKELGGKVMIGPQDIPDAGRFAILTLSLIHI